MERRKFIQYSLLSGGAIFVKAPDVLRMDKKPLSGEPDVFTSGYLNVSLDKSHPAFTCLQTDSSGNQKFQENPVIKPKVPETAGYRVKAGNDWVEYIPLNAPDPEWKFNFNDNGFSLISFHGAGEGIAFDLQINQEINHATVLGLTDRPGEIKLPCVIHFPAMGSLRVNSTSKDAVLLFDARRDVSPHFVRIQFPPATNDQGSLSYDVEVTQIYPSLQGMEQDTLYEGFRRNFINIFQINPKLQVLANNSSSDPCAFTLFEYSDIALYTPPLAEGLTALMLLRQTLDKYLAGFKAYGMKGYHIFGDNSDSSDSGVVSDFLDTYPSLLIAAFNYVKGTKDLNWLKKNYSGIRSWADRMFSYDKDGDGLLEYPLSGNSGSWGNSDKVVARPSNWWDTIGFGHKDAYANALAYRAALGLQQLADWAGNSEESMVYKKKAERIKAVYYKTFYNPDTGILAGWKSADGKIHDYYFTFVNGVAITYGLIEDEEANGIMDRVLAKMKEVGYDNFSLGLPGNLVPVRREDYVHHDRRWGGGVKEDGSDGFQIYENGGATACYSYFTIRALQKLKRKKEADNILNPILTSIGAGNFQGKCNNGMTRDWKTWTGECWGYEGFLVDSYHVLLALVEDRQ